MTNFQSLDSFWFELDKRIGLLYRINYDMSTLILKYFQHPYL